MQLCIMKLNYLYLLDVLTICNKYLLKEVLIITIIKGGMSYEKTKEAIEKYVKNGGVLNSKDICDENLISVICYNYLEEYGLLSEDDNSNFCLNKNTETDLEIHKRNSGIVYFLEWIKNNGFHNQDCENYLNNIDLDRYESPIVIASCVGHDMYLMEYLVNNGYEEMLNTQIDDEDSSKIIDFIWKDIDLNSENYRYISEEYKNDEITLYKNDARLLKYLIYLGCQERDGFIVEVNTDLTISFTGPRYLY